MTAGGRGRTWRLASRTAQAGVVAGLIALHALAGWWRWGRTTGFGTAASPWPADTAAMRAAPKRATVAPAVAAGTAWARRVHFFPEGFQRGVEESLASDNYLVFYGGGLAGGAGRPVFSPVCDLGEDAAGAAVAVGAGRGGVVVGAAHAGRAGRL